MKKTVLVAIKKPNQPLEVKEIEDKLEVLQKIVEGYIEVIYPMENLEEHSITMFGNSEAKMIHKPSNFWLYNQQDCACGTVIFFKDDEGDNMASLQPKDIQEIEKFLEKNKMNTFEHKIMDKYIKGNF